MMRISSISNINYRGISNTKAVAIRQQQQSALELFDAQSELLDMRSEESAYYEHR